MFGAADRHWFGSVAPLEPVSLRRRLQNGYAGRAAVAALAEGHSFAYRGAGMWIDDVVRFVDAKCR
jgi:hypothetical protein